MRLVEDKGTFKILKVYTSPENATDNDLVWTSSNKKVAKVVGGNFSAKLLIKDYGKAKITVTSKKNKKVKATFTVTVNNEVVVSDSEYNEIRQLTNTMNELDNALLTLTTSQPKS